MKSIKYIIGLCTILAACSNETKINEEAVPKAEIKTEISNGIATSSFKIWGNCDMCKETIESSLKVDGVEKADWDVDSKMMTVTYDASKITLEQIQKKIAAAGYDNVMFKGSDSAYKELPECCQYDRKE